MVICRLSAPHCFFLQKQNLEIGKKLPQVGLIREMYLPNPDELASFELCFCVVVNTHPQAEVGMTRRKPVDSDEQPLWRQFVPNHAQHFLD